MIDKLAYIELKDNKILAARSRNNDTFYIPGGKRETGETDAEALEREIKEELSVEIAPATIAFYGEFKAQAHHKPEGVLVNMRCYTGTYTGELQPAAEIEEVAWLTHADRHRVSEVAQLIFDDLKAKGLLH